LSKNCQQGSGGLPTAPDLDALLLTSLSDI